MSAPNNGATWSPQTAGSVVALRFVGAAGPAGTGVGTGPQVTLKLTLLLYTSGCPAEMPCTHI